MTTVRIINHSKNGLPAYETAHAAGMDLRADLETQVTLLPMERKLIPTGLHVELPEGFEAQIRPRSGLALKHGIGIVNSPGTVDADYRGEIKVLLINFSDQAFVINNGDRIAQMIIARYEHINWEQVEILTETSRGLGGYGHTGVI
jgi:dUTP pyrophosphatase